MTARPPVPGRISEQNLKNLAEGMRLEDVEAILGAPGDYRTPQSGSFYMLTGGWNRDRNREWMTDDLMVIVRFDDEGRVVEWASVEPALRFEPPGLLDRLRAWLRW
jgi:hypothetical protein